MQKGVAKCLEMLYNKGKLFFVGVKMNFLKQKYSKMHFAARFLRGKYEKIFRTFKE